MPSSQHFLRFLSVYSAAASTQMAPSGPGTLQHPQRGQDSLVSPGPRDDLVSPGPPTLLAFVLDELQAAALAFRRLFALDFWGQRGLGSGCHSPKPRGLHPPGMSQQPWRHPRLSPFPARPLPDLCGVLMFTLEARLRPASAKTPMWFLPLPAVQPMSLFSTVSQTWSRQGTAVTATAVTQGWWGQRGGEPGCPPWSG